MKINLYTDLNIQECIRFLNNDLKGYCIFDGFYGKIKNHDFWIIHSSAKSFGLKYGAPKFKGRLATKEKGTWIEGSFTGKLISIFHIIATIWVVVLGMVFFSGAFSDLFFGTKLVVPSGKISILCGMIISLIFIVGSILFQKYTMNLRKKDIEEIKKYLVEKFEAKIIEK